VLVRGRCDKPRHSVDVGRETRSTTVRFSSPLYLSCEAPTGRDLFDPLHQTLFSDRPRLSLTANRSSLDHTNTQNKRPVIRIARPGFATGFSPVVLGRLAAHLEL
jgi:hypothetical protein